MNVVLIVKRLLAARLLEGEVQCYRLLVTHAVLDALVGDRLDRIAGVGILEQRLRRAVAAVLVQLASAVEDDERYLAATQDAELVRLLDDAVAALLERDL